MNESLRLEDCGEGHVSAPVQKMTTSTTAQSLHSHTCPTKSRDISSEPKIHNAGGWKSRKAADKQTHTDMQERLRHQTCHTNHYNYHYSNTQQHGPGDLTHLGGHHKSSTQTSGTTSFYF